MSVSSLIGSSAIRSCLGPMAHRTPPKFDVPVGAWDMHFHILGPQNRFAYSANRKYTPPDASIEQYRHMQQMLGLSGGLVVHANTHGFDNGVDLDAVERLGPEQHFAVVRVDASIRAERIAMWHFLGVRGVRFAFNPEHGGNLDKILLQKTAELIGPYGWFIELHAAPADLLALAPWLAKLDIRLVIDHVGRIDVSLGMEQPVFDALQTLVCTRDVWVKFSGADRITKEGSPYSDVVPFAKRLMELAPQRMLWGSDWPHTGIFDPARIPDDGELLNLIVEYAPTEELRKALLIDNPRRLIGL